MSDDARAPFLLTPELPLPANPPTQPVAPIELALVLDLLVEIIEFVHDNRELLTPLDAEALNEISDIQKRALELAKLLRP